MAGCQAAGSGICRDVWIGRDNTFTLRLEKEDLSGTTAPVDLTDVTQMTLYVGSYEVTSTAAQQDAPIDWWTVDAANGMTLFALGEWAASTPVPPGKYAAKLIVYDLANPDGVVWFGPDYNVLTLWVRD